MLTQDPRTGLYFRPDEWGDNYVLRTVAHDYRELPLGPGDVVLDGGAHIGTFTYLALQAGATRVVAYEPAPGNYAVLHKNFRSVASVELHNAALANQVGSATLFCGPRDNCGYSLVPTRRRTVVTVPTVSLQTELARVVPSLVKLDVERAEYQLDLTMPTSVCCVVIELHRLNEKTSRAKAVGVLECLAEQGFALVREPHWNYWNSVVVWVRNGSRDGPKALRPQPGLNP